MMTRNGDDDDDPVVNVFGVLPKSLIQGGAEVTIDVKIAFGNLQRFLCLSDFDVGSGGFGIVIFRVDCNSLPPTEAYALLG